MIMKKSILLTILLVVVISQMVFSQWSADPNNTLIVGYGLDPHICSDSAGGCYITYDYDNIYYPRKLGLERLDRYGYKPWGTLKQILGEFPQQYRAQIAEDGEGGVLISYIDRYENLPEWTQRVRVQRADSNGNFLWGQYGIKVTLSTVNQGDHYLTSDGEGGCVICWQDVSYTYYINRIDNNGNRIWGDNGITLHTGPYNNQPKVVRASDGNYYVQGGSKIYRIRPSGEIVRIDSVMLGYMVSDTEGGIVISDKVWVGMIPKLVTQRKDSLGNNLWQEPYVEIVDSLYINTQIRTQNNGDYFYFGWSGAKNGFDRVAQFQVLRADGSKLFSQGSMQLSENSPIGSPMIVPSELSKTIFIWNDPTISSSTIAQKYDTLGNKLWNENGIIISYPAIAYETTTDSKGGFITMGPINQFTIVVQQVNKYGQLGNVIIPVEFICFNAEVVSNIVKLSWITATETNNRGFEIQRSEVSSQRSVVGNWEKIGFVKGNGTTTEPKSYSFINNNIFDVMYKYRLKQIDYDGTFKYSKEIEVDVNYSPKEYILYQNYPNPFNPITNIEYRIPNKEFVTLMVYDVLGNEVATLVNEEKPAGRYEVIFDGSNLPAGKAGLSSGVYIYRITAGDYSASKKLMLLK